MKTTLSPGKFALFLFGFIVILFEIILTRLASAFFQYHYAFVALSLAMLSFCLSGLVYQKIKDNERKLFFHASLFLLPALFLFLLFFLAFFNNNPVTSMVIIPIFGFAILFLGSFITVLLLDKEKEPRLSYGLNLLGSGVGALAAIFVLSFSDPYKGLAICSVFSAIGLWNFFDRKKALMLTALFIVLSLPFFIITINSPGVIWEKWNSFSKVSVYASEDGPIVWGTPNVSKSEIPKSLLLLVDSNAGMVIVLEPEKSSVIARDITHAGYYFLHNGSSVAIIGSGGGRDIVGAKNFSPSSILAIELNPSIIEASKKFSPETYRDVELTVADGRDALENSRSKFDFLQLSLVDTWAALSSGSHALAENYLYTSEAFETYLNSLNQDGLLSITYWSPYQEKLLSLALVSLKRTGVQEPLRNVIILKQANMITVLVKKTPWDEKELVFARSLAKRNDYELVLPNNTEVKSVNTDDSPFFFFNENGLSIILLIVSTVIITQIFFAATKASKTLIAYFVLIGFGYLIIESIFVQKFLLIIHDPTFTVSTVFASFLIFSGVGSFLSERVSFRYSLAIVPLLLIFIFGWGSITSLFYGMSIPSKAVLCAIVIAPLAILMGLFFPKGLSHLKDKKIDEFGTAWTVNGLSSVFAPIATLIISVYFGFTFALVLAAAVYLGACLIGLRNFK